MQMLHPQFSAGRMRPVHQPAIQPAEATVHGKTEQADYSDADEDDVEHEQLPGPDHQVADTLTGGEQLDRQQG
ncbi:hypothetical protein D9M71_389480 [compost metagenome]